MLPPSIARRASLPPRHASWLVRMPARLGLIVAPVRSASQPPRLGASHFSHSLGPPAGLVSRVRLHIPLLTEGLRRANPYRWAMRRRRCQVPCLCAVSPSLGFAASVVVYKTTCWRGGGVAERPGNGLRGLMQCRHPARRAVRDEQHQRRCVVGAGRARWSGSVGFTDDVHRRPFLVPTALDRVIPPTVVFAALGVRRGGRRRKNHPKPAPARGGAAADSSKVCVWAEGCGRGAGGAGGHTMELTSVSGVAGGGLPPTGAPGGGGGTGEGGEGDGLRLLAPSPAAQGRARFGRR